jgi:hypothetical protein
MNYAGNLHNTPENVMFMNAAEDADVIGLQIANKDNRILDYQHFTPGQSQHPLSTRDRIMHVGQEYRPPFYGHIALFNLREHLISPFLTGYEGTGRREPVSEQHRHPPLREAAGRHRRLRAPLRRDARSPRDRARHGEGVSRGRGARRRELPRALVAERGHSRRSTSGTRS